MTELKIESASVKLVRCNSSDADVRGDRVIDLCCFVVPKATEKRRDSV
jgi:hypothetical protein